ncbi:Serine/threonine-protein phosphatase 1 [Thalassocella blandensis]|nr:Serine/threonine-protein phosphatase 1 [Thalassocella blandensis]
MFCSLLKNISKNTNGRDFICSDIHGHFSILEGYLASVGFDPVRDRLFCLGDLIDRGDDSYRSLEFLAKPWFYSIQGNHERMLINVCEQQLDALRFDWFSWGGDWAEDLTDDELQVYYDAFYKLPVAIELELKGGNSVALVHAELPDACDWLDMKTQLTQTRAEDAELNLVISDMLWKKSQAYYSTIEVFQIENVSNIHHVFHGHTVMDEFLTIGNRTFMDLGSYKTGEIGLIDVERFLESLK